MLYDNITRSEDVLRNIINISSFLKILPHNGTEFTEDTKEIKKFSLVSQPLPLIQENLTQRRIGLKVREHKELKCPNVGAAFGVDPPVFQRQLLKRSRWG